MAETKKTKKILPIAKKVKKAKPVKKKTPGHKAASKTAKKPASRPGKIAISKKATSSKKTVSKEKSYFAGVGRRKRAIARVRLVTARPFEGEVGRIEINGRGYQQYFSGVAAQQIVESSLRRLKSLNRFEVSVKVRGGGLAAQAEAVRHGIARALIVFNPDFRKKLRRAGFLTRDPREKERRKFGLKKARRAPQWSKR
ncbi:MAG: 30S ribosomal protein S9 [Candidatus Portnoybacteria bacterium CG10_big_fil_rev_8_21_14_0_10_44_7]|uniref:Small ribosomal subunit protein uS9 n=1 Tax=Candidatus Portnoybacteria bacterium CG10_big_fil_rev_8_21_14_0_10_44_7 TaxID=1974816 RepID=A0A2M8KJA6_9BACT|nr:MAG: 30S ribosomal protein S9 [Candidatus Portnoybacteria bacterium CG10_big_fil_rev_8_21_14_0_10_44_7]